MGRLIDEAITWLNTDDYESKGFADATIVAIDTMRKYQQIEMIIRRYDATWEFHHMKPTIDKIREVLDDGKID